MIIYGIKNCDTMQKAFKYLDKHKIKYTFHNYKTEGIDKETIKAWLEIFPLDQVINTKSATFKALSDEDKAKIKIKSKAINLMISNTSMIKRPLVVIEPKKILLGFSEQDWNDKFSS